MKKVFSFLFYTLFFSPLSLFASTPKINTGDTAWVLISSALVMLMTPGLAFFYGGMIRRKNILSIFMQTFSLLALISLQWVLFGYSLAFSYGNKFIGSFNWILLKNIGLSTGPYSPTIPHIAFIIFQGMFAIITPALMIGSFVERMKYKFFVFFTLIWSILVYIPICHWVWAKDGWLSSIGALDFAGGTVVHINAGFSALILAILIGKRKEVSSLGPTPSNIPFTILGTALLWFGWFSFNAGSSLGANSIAANAFLVTNTAASAAAISWIIIEKIFEGKPTTLGMATGAVAGLVAITPASGFVDIIGSIIIGLLVSPICFFMVSTFKKHFNYDDSLDVFGVHGIGGVVGAILTGFFANPSINNAGTGAIFGNINQIWIQLISVIVVVVYSSLSTFLIFKFLTLFLPARISPKEESIGIDLSEHNERAYTLIE